MVWTRVTSRCPFTNLQRNVESSSNIFLCFHFLLFSWVRIELQIIMIMQFSQLTYSFWVQFLGWGGLILYLIASVFAFSLFLMGSLRRLWSWFLINICATSCQDQYKFRFVDLGHQCQCLGILFVRTVRFWNLESKFWSSQEIFIWKNSLPCMS